MQEFKLVAEAPPEPDSYYDMARVPATQEVVLSQMAEVGERLARAVSKLERAKAAVREAKAQALLDAVADSREKRDKPTVAVLEAMAAVSADVHNAEDHLAAAMEEKQRVWCEWEILDTRAALLPSMMKRANRIFEIESS